MTALYATTDPVSALRHLSAQIRDVYALDPAEARSEIPTEEWVLKEKLFERLERPAPRGERLILIVDGLDEFRTPFNDTFLGETLCDGVFVVVSGRADFGTSPSYLRPWLEAQLGEAPVIRYEVGRLGEADVLTWLEEGIGHLDKAEMRDLASRLRRITDRVPLFLSDVIKDLCKRLPTAATREERIALVADLPDSFRKYIDQQLRELNRVIGVNDNYRLLIKLFAVLTKTRGPIGIGDINALFDFHQTSNPAYRGLPLLTEIHLRVVRWLSIQGEGDACRVAFTHPRLAQAFAEALGEQSKCAEDELIEWMESAWRGETTRWKVNLGAEYALEWLPDHLASRGERREAARLLSSPTFLAARLAEPGSAVRRLRNSLEAWNALAVEEQDSVAGSARWRAFWGENERSLSRATEVATAIGLKPLLPLLSCLGDVDSAGSDEAPPKSIARTAHVPTPPALLHSIAAYRGWINGVELIGERLVIWGADGAICFWTLDGGRSSGGDDHAHEGWVKGVVPFGERLVSWDYDGAIRFWGRDGECINGGDDHAHSGEIFGVLPFGDRLVSWGDDGAIRFWGRDGKRIHSGYDHAHDGYVIGVLTVDDWLVSWGRDGAMRFWGRDGKRINGGDAHVHDGYVIGVLTVDDWLVSWGRDGAIRFWSLDGKRTNGGDEHAHTGRVVGVLLVGGRLVSWGDDGVIRFWTLDGMRINGGDDHAHTGRVVGVLPVGDRLVSWGSDGAIWFWTLDGMRAEGGDEHAHQGPVEGVVPFGDRLVSWGNDGAIWFWALDGARAEGGDERAHEGAVEGVVPFGDRLVSWGQDGNVRLWSRDGQPIGVIVPPGGVTYCCGQENLLTAVGRWVWVYDPAKLESANNLATTVLRHMH